MKEALFLQARSDSSQRSFDPHFRHALYVLLVAFYCIGHAADASAQTWTNVWPVYQYVRAIANDPVNVSNIYVGLETDSGFYPLTDVYKSSDGGLTWYDASVGLPADTAGCKALAVDPVTPTTIYAALANNGVYKSTDGGGTWVAINNGLPTPFGQDLWAISVDPVTPSTIYVGEEYDGLYKSTNGGATWTPVTTGLPAGATIASLAHDPVTPSTMYAGLYGAPSGVYKSTDDGNSWSPSGGGMTASTDIRAIVINSQTTSTLYAAVDDVAGVATGGVYVSTNGGASWSYKTVVQGVPLHGFAIDPVTPTTLYAGNFGAGVYRSTDGGNTWAPFQNGETDPAVHGIVIALTNPLTVYAATCNTGVFAVQSGTGPAFTVVVNPGVVAGGNSVTGTFALNNTSGGSATLTSSNTSVATVPPSVTVMAGSSSATFAIDTFAVTSPTVVAISATFNGTIRAINLLVTPGINSVVLSPASVAGGQPSTGTVSLTGTSSSNVVISLASSNSAVAGVPATVTVPAGEISVDFSVNTDVVSTSQSPTITASYNESSAYATLTVTPAGAKATTTTVTTAPNPSTFGQSVTFTATVTSGSGAPVGTVAFTDGLTTLASGVAVNGSGQASFSTSALPAGSQTITASFTGTSGWLNSSGNSAPQVVHDGTVTTVVSSPNPSSYWQGVTFTATVTAANNGAGTPTGTVTFTEGATTLASAVVVNGSGQASFITSALAVGSNVITATFTGTNGWQNSSGNAAPQVVQGSTATAAVSAPNPSSFGQSVTFTATITANTGYPGAGTPTGTVTFSNGATTLASGVAVNAGGQASFSTTALAVGSQTITATFTGTNSWKNSSANAAPQVVQDGTATAVVSAPNPSTFGQSVTFTATITAAGTGAGIPTGTVTFTEGATTLASGVAVNGSGQASLSTTALAVGSNVITVTFTGTNGWQNSSGNSAPQSVVTGDPVITGLTPTSGVAGVTQVTITGSGFGSSPGGVSLGSSWATVNSWSNTQVVATVGVYASTNAGAAVENAAGVWSNFAAFTLSRPTITSISPTTGAPGVTPVTITGSGFGSSPGGVSLGSSWATVNSWSNTQVVVTPNPGAALGTGVAEVENAGGAWSNAVSFTVSNSSSATPTITGITPTAGVAGVTQVTITGSGFGTSPGGVSLGSSWATVNSWSNTQVVATVGVYASTNAGAAVENAAGVWSNFAAFTLSRPTVTSISPTTGTPGVTPVTITGSGFGSSPGGVSLGGAWATVNSWSNTQVVVTPNAGAALGTGVAEVENAGGAWSNAVSFTVSNSSSATPTITGITPTAGVAGVTQVTIKGSGFGTSPGGVSLGSSWATVNSWSNTQVVATVGVYASTNAGAAVENASGVWSNFAAFAVSLPTITGVTPTTGTAGVTQVTITGSGFGSSPGGVSLGGAWATVISWSNTQVVVTPNPGAALGTGIAEVENTGGAWSNAVAFTLGP